MVDHTCIDPPPLANTSAERQDAQQTVAVQVEHSEQAKHLNGKHLGSQESAALPWPALICAPCGCCGLGPVALQLCRAAAAGALFRGWFTPLPPVPPILRGATPPPSRRCPPAGMLGHCDPPAFPAKSPGPPAGHDLRASRLGRAPLRWPAMPTLQVHCHLFRGCSGRHT